MPITLRKLQRWTTHASRLPVRRIPLQHFDGRSQILGNRVLQWRLVQRILRLWIRSSLDEQLNPIALL